jgi:hypothetical protein
MFKGRINQVFSGNDVASERDSSFLHDSFTGDFIFHAETLTSVTYDNHPCPFYKLYPKRLIESEYVSYVADDFYLYYSIPQSHNITEERRTVNPSSSGIATYHATFTYEYNANGYPSVVNWTDLETGDVAKGIYVYQ